VGSVAQIRCRRVVALLPDVPREGLVAVDVALVVEADPAEDGVELVAV
jgi:hypothetical protein